MPATRRAGLKSGPTLDAQPAEASVPEPRSSSESSVRRRSANDGRRLRALGPWTLGTAAAVLILLGGSAGAAAPATYLHWSAPFHGASLSFSPTPDNHCRTAVVGGPRIFSKQGRLEFNLTVVGGVNSSLCPRGGPPGYRSTSAEGIFVSNFTSTRSGPVTVRAVWKVAWIVNLSVPAAHPSGYLAGAEAYGTVVLYDRTTGATWTSPGSGGFAYDHGVDLIGNVTNVNVSFSKLLSFPIPATLTRGDAYSLMLTLGMSATVYSVVRSFGPVTSHATFGPAGSKAGLVSVSIS